MLHLAPLLALTDEEVARSLRQGFGRETSSTWLFVIFFMGLGLALIWAYWQNRSLAPAHSDAPLPLDLFNELSRDLALSRLDRHLLIRITREQALPTPITLLVSPRTLRHHAAAFAQSLSPRRRARVLFRIAKLRRSLFSA